MKKMIRACKSLVLVCVLSACVFVPQKERSSSEGCDVYKAKWSLAAEPLRGYIDCHGSGQDTQACMLSVGVVLPLGSLIISGSIVLIGNTLHWLAHSKRCVQHKISGG